ncbi:MAG: CRISPR-associated endonuclease Cas1 [Nitrospinota bacterium]
MESLKKTVYLNEKKDLVVRRDGPSLLIEEENKAGRRIPPGLIGQVIIRGNVRIESGVIMLLAEHGVPVMFLSRKKGITAVTLTFDSGNEVLRSKVINLANSCSGQERVKILLNSIRQNLKRKLIKDLFPDKAWIIDEKGLKEKECQKYIESAYSYVEKGGTEIIGLTIAGLLKEFILKMVIDTGLDPHVGFIHRYCDFALVKDICHAIEAEKERQMIQFLKYPSYKRYMEKKADGWVINNEGMKNISERFENRKKNIHEFMNHLLNSFFEIMRESVNEGQLSYML